MYGRVGSTQSRSGRFLEKTKPLSLAGFEPRTVQPAAKYKVSLSPSRKQRVTLSKNVGI